MSTLGLLGTGLFSPLFYSLQFYYNTKKIKNDEEYNTFLKTITNRSQYKFNTSINTMDKIITLSTCQNDYGKRIVVHAKLIKKETRS